MIFVIFKAAVSQSLWEAASLEHGCCKTVSESLQGTVASIQHCNISTEIFSTQFFLPDFSCKNIDRLYFVKGVFSLGRLIQWEKYLNYINHGGNLTLLKICVLINFQIKILQSKSIDRKIVYKNLHRIHLTEHSLYFILKLQNFPLFNFCLKKNLVKVNILFSAEKRLI